MTELAAFALRHDPPRLPAATAVAPAASQPRVERHAASSGQLPLAPSPPSEAAPRDDAALVTYWVAG